ncbi:MAG: hypothetical protein WBQ23_16715 [Bacteroidota bacterium]
MSRCLSFTACLLLAIITHGFAQDTLADATWHYAPAFESLRLDLTAIPSISFGANLDVDFFEQRIAAGEGYLAGLRTGIDATILTYDWYVPMATDRHLLLRGTRYDGWTRYDAFAGIAYRKYEDLEITNQSNRGLSKYTWVLKAGVETSRVLWSPILGVHARIMLVYGEQLSKSLLDYIASIGFGLSLGWSRDHEVISP